MALKTAAFIKTLKQTSCKGILKAALLITLLVVIGFAGKSVDFDSFFRSLPFLAEDETTWWNGKFGYVILAGLLASIGCPRQAVSFFAAYFFGLWAGILLGLLATTFGCILSFWTARIFQGYFIPLVKGRMQSALQFWKDNTFYSMVIWRFLPAGSNLLTNLAAGALGISAWQFFAGSFLGYIPQTVVFAILGAGIEVGSYFQIAVSVILFVISVLLGLMLFARYKKQVNNVALSTNA